MKKWIFWLFLVLPSIGNSNDTGFVCAPTLLGHPIFVTLEKLRLTHPNQLKGSKFNPYWMLNDQEALGLVFQEFSNPNNLFKTVWNFVINYEYYSEAIGNKVSLRWDNDSCQRNRKSFVINLTFEIAYHQQNQEDLELKDIKFEIPGINKEPEKLAQEYLTWVARKTKQLVPVKNDNFSKVLAQLFPLGVTRKQVDYQPKINATLQKQLKLYYIATGKKKIEDNIINDTSFGALLIHDEMGSPFWHFLQLVKLFNGLENYLKAIGLKPSEKIEDIYFEFLVQGAISYLNTSGDLKNFTGFQIDDIAKENFLNLFDDQVRLAWKKYDSNSRLLTALNIEIMRRKS